MRKYKKGEQIETLNELMDQELIYMGKQILSRGWFGNWQMHLACQYIKRGYLYKAIKKEGGQDNG